MNCPNCKGELIDSGRYQEWASNTTLIEVPKNCPVFQHLECPVCKYRTKFVVKEANDG